MNLNLENLKENATVVRKDTAKMLKIANEMLVSAVTGDSDVVEDQAKELLVPAFEMIVKALDMMDETIALAENQDKKMEEVINKLNEIEKMLQRLADVKS